ncbi:MAG TPA: hypothetical protein DCL44_00505 [Elusimicrobia bacterium]|nr:hypothetical protein [Elusimicrobiota bacterium]
MANPFVKSVTEWPSGPALSSFGIALLCLLELAGVVPRFAGTLMTIQFVVIHSSIFVAAIPLTRAEEPVQRGMFLLLISCYTLLAYHANGLYGVFQFAGLTYSTYAGYIFNKEEASAKIELALRWLTAFLAFILAVSIAGTPERVESWDGNNRLALAGFVYFIALGLLEKSGLYRERWKNILRKLAEKDPQFRKNMPGWLSLALYKAEKRPGEPPAAGGSSA